MLQFMRDKAKSWVTFVIVGIIAFMMAITGLETLAPNPNNPEVASVNGKDITRAELAQAVDQQRRMLVQQMGDQFDPSLLDDKLLQESVLQSLIDRQLMLQDAEGSKMEVGTQALDQLIVSMPQFQVDGQFNQDRYQMMVRSYGMSPLQFRETLREEILLQQLRSGIVDSEFVTRKELEKLNALERQTRDLSWTTLEVAPVRAAINPSDDEIQTYYDANQDHFMTPEQVVIRYVELNKADIAKTIMVPEEDVRREFDLRIKELQDRSAASASVSAILIEEGSKRSADEAQARAEEVIAKLRGGADFAELAKEYSDDPVTSGKGGDLGEVQPGFFGDAFDSAVAGLSVGEVSDPVQTSFGIQVLKVTGRQQQELPSFESLRAEIETSLKQSEVDDLYLQQSRELADISFESSDLSQPAEKLGLTIRTSDAFSRSGGAGITADQRIINAAFSDDVLDLGANSELIEITPEQSVVVRVKEHNRPELMPLAEVKDSVILTLRNQQAEQQLQDKAQELIARLQAGDDQKKIADENGFEWKAEVKVPRSQPGIPAKLLQKAFTMANPGNGVVYDTVILPTGDLGLISLSAIYPGETQGDDAERLKLISQFIASDTGRNQFTDYLRSLKQRGKIDNHLDED